MPLEDSINPYCPEDDRPIERYCVMKADEKFIDCAGEATKNYPYSYSKRFLNTRQYDNVLFSVEV